MSDPALPLLVILGPTASGKTRLAVAAARALSGEIISADSRQVYRGMDLGTGKDLAEYGATPCHLIDIVAPGEEYSLFRFQKDCFDAITRLADRGRLPILCGGSGLYLDAVLRGYRLAEVPANPTLRAELAGASDAELAARLRQLRPQQHNTTDLGDRQRLLRAIEIASGEITLAAQLPPLPQLLPKVFGLRWERSMLRRRIARRLHERLEQGLLEEVTRLHATGVPWSRLEFFGLEYRFVAWHLQGRLNRNDMIQQLTSAIGAFAKRQETFFRRMEKQGVAIHWLDGQSEPLAELLAELGRQTAGPLRP